MSELLVHPPIVQFPAVLLLLAVFSGFVAKLLPKQVSYESASAFQDIFCILACLALVASYLSGLYSLRGLEQVESYEALLHQHAFLGKLLLLCMVPCLTLLYIKRFVAG